MQDENIFEILHVYIFYSMFAYLLYHLVAHFFLFFFSIYMKEVKINSKYLFNITDLITNKITHNPNIEKE